MSNRSQLQLLILLRLILITLVSAAALSTSLFGPFTSHFLKLFLLVVYALSGIYFLFLRYTNRPQELYSLQFFSDLILVSLLVFASGGTGSPFSPLYVLIVVYASLLRERKGAILAVSLCILSYVVVAHLEYTGRIPGLADAPPYSELVYRLLWSVLGFVSVAVLGSYLSERLKKTRQELGEVKMLHDNIVNSMRSALITLDLRGQVTSFNRAASEIFGGELQQILGKPLDQLFPSRVLEAVRETDLRLRSRALRMEFWLPDDQNQQVYIGTSCSPLMTQSEEHIGYILSCQDLTEIKKREEELQLKEKMAAIGQVAAGLAHEIRNPLAALSGSIQILRSELQLRNDQERLIEIALRECNRLNQTVSDFLTYAGPPLPRSRRVELVSLVREIVALVERSPDFKKSHSVAIEAFPSELPCMVDPDQLNQVIWNILQNALRAMPNGGRIRIGIGEEDAQVRLSIKDEGIGMSESEKAKMFQPFHSGFKKGVGLGMAIVYQIVQQHGGRLEVESHPRKGTEVCLCLPANCSQAPQQPVSA